MSPTLSSPLAVGAVIAAGTSAMQATPLHSMVVPLVSAVIGAVFSYAVLKTTVKTIEKDLFLMRKDLGQVYDLLRDSSTRIARIEGRMEER